MEHNQEAEASEVGGIALWRVMLSSEYFLKFDIPCVVVDDLLELFSNRNGLPSSQLTNWSSKLAVLELLAQVPMTLGHVIEQMVDRASSQEKRVIHDVEQRILNCNQRIPPPA